MSFIGNDIMFFENNVNTFLRKGAVQHILSENEFSNDSVNHFPMIAWTIKESIYKILCKEGYRKAFAPKNITISKFDKMDNNSYAGEAIFQNSKYYFHSQITDTFIYTFAADDLNKFPKINHHYFKNEIDVENKEFLQFLQKNKWKINHTKEGIPYVSGKKRKVDISITHDSHVLVVSECTYHQN